MTRINLVPVQELSDQHLFAEFREIKMIGPSLRRSIAAHGVEVYRRIPSEFTLGKGHVTFFYNKGAYLHSRFEQLKQELDLRGVQFNRDAVLDTEGTLAEQPWFRGYTPTEAALKLVRARIQEKLALKPDWYRWWGRAGCTPRHLPSEGN